MNAGSLRASLGIDAVVLEDVRAAGALLVARVPELIERFYAWLADSPEFARFFAADPALLARVKRHQTAYWCDFLAADVDEEYVERRRVVGDTHGRIELGLLVYLRAMELIATWLVEQAEADDRLRRERPTIAFSIRKLIQFDSAIVVNTYAVRTVKMLDAQRARLEHVARVMRAVTAGDLEHRVELAGPGDLLGASVNDMVASLRLIAREMRMIARAELSADVVPRSERDELGASLQAMTKALREAAERGERHMWLIKSQTELGEAMTGNPDVKELSQRVLAYLCRGLGAQVGAQYVLADGVLHLAATYATAEGDGVPARWRLGEGLVGQAALERRRIVIDDVPADGLKIRWGLGAAVPRHVVIVPLVHDGDVRGVIELGSLGRFPEHQLELLDRASPSVGLALASADARARIGQLLQESQAQAEELASQQTELRQVNDLLEEQTRALEAQKDTLLAAETVLRHKATELERASRYKSDFLANMSHELRTPLNSALILAKLLADNREGNLTADQVKYAQTIYGAGNDLLALIDDILDLSKIEAGKLDLVVGPVAIARLVDQLERRFAPIVADKGLQFAIAVAPSCPASIESDAQRIQQILTNFLANAVKFTERGVIRLDVASHGADHVAFTVEDTGIGIAAEQHEVIFEAFRQADGTTNRKFGGTGLGLSISRELAALMDGEIQLRSAPGAGSAFTLLVPVRAGLPARRAAPDLPPDLPPVSIRPAPPSDVPPPPIDDDRDALTDANRIVLVVEDDPAFARILRDLGRELGFHCLVAGTATEGLRLAREHRPAAVMLDIGLPDRSGLSVLELLKRDPATRHVPIHVVSVYDYQRIARAMGAAGFELKPVKREELEAAFRALEEQLARAVKTVLVVEDDAVQRDAIVQLLSIDRVEIAMAATVEDALGKLREATFDCAVVDLMLPDASGFELLERMAEDETCASPPVIVYTARPLTVADEHKLRRLSRSIIIKGARSPERLLEEVTLFLHQAESELPADKRRMLAVARDREALLEGRRVLLVEDDARNIFALTSMLEPKGLLVEVARNGREALARLESGPPPDLVLMDIMMPEMDGIEATRELRKHGRWSSLPVIALTAKAMPDDRQRCLVAGANDYIAKPIDVDGLLSLLRVWMPR